MVLQNDFIMKAVSWMDSRHVMFPCIGVINGGPCIVCAHGKALVDGASTFTHP
jgi:hypothetical protein